MNDKLWKLIRSRGTARSANVLTRGTKHAHTIRSERQLKRFIARHTTADDRARLCRELEALGAKPR